VTDGVANSIITSLDTRCADYIDLYSRLT